MKYGIIKVINGNYLVHAEGITSVAQAKTIFHGLCQTLWNAPDVLSAYVMIVDEQLDAVEGYKEYIHHDPQPEPTPAPEPEPEPTPDPEESVDEPTEPGTEDTTETNEEDNSWYENA